MAGRPRSGVAFRDMSKTQVASEQMGSRWLHAPPTSDEVKAWFSGQRLHDGMNPDLYVSGIVLINSAEKVKATVVADDGQRYVDETEQAVFTPYVKVDTRVSYFWDLVHRLNQQVERDDEEYVGAIEPADVPVVEDPSSPFYNAYLPRGFHFQAVRNKDDSITKYVCFTAMADITRWNGRGTTSDHGSPTAFLRGTGTKQVAALDGYGFADDFAMMKAETGAVGRALGMAGILVIGTGVATAEDMQEAAGGSVRAGGSTVNSGPSLPDVVTATPVAEQPIQAVPIQADIASAPDAPTPTPDGQPPTWEQMDQEARITYVKGLARAYREEFKIEYDNVLMPWWKDREFDQVEMLSEDELQVVVIKLERDLDNLRTAR